MKRSIFTLALLTATLGSVLAQEPNITSWLQNTTQTGSYYMSGNSTPISNGVLVNCQKVEYSADYVYITASGIPSYPTGPFLDGNPSIAEDQSGIYKIPRFPQENTGAPDITVPGNVGIFINGVALFDYRDGVAWNPNTMALCGGPGNPPCPGGMGVQMDWNRDAINAEKGGFDCSKGHPAMGNYHHHQNPSAFKLDLDVVSTVCNLYDADGLYTIDSTKHSPLLGFAYDGWPIYGAYAFKNNDGSGPIVRMHSSYQLRNMTQRTHAPDGTDVDDGPDVDATYYLGYFREDYEFIGHPGEDEYLDDHNGRYCVTPEFPGGTYAYFCTVDEKWNSTYPYAIGPTFYGNYENRKVTAVTETTTVYEPGTGPNAIIEHLPSQLEVNLFPNPSADLIAIQINGLVEDNITVELIDLQGRQIAKTQINMGQTIAYFDLQTVYEGTYLVKLSDGERLWTEKVVVSK